MKIMGGVDVSEMIGHFFNQDNLYSRKRGMLVLPVYGVGVLPGHIETALEAYAGVRSGNIKEQIRVRGAYKSLGSGTSSVMRLSLSNKRIMLLCDEGGMTDQQVQSAAMKVATCSITRRDEISMDCYVHINASNVMERFAREIAKLPRMDEVLIVCQTEPVDSKW